MFFFDYGRLRKLRKENKLSQKDVADQINCTAPKISKIELGESAVTAQELALLAGLYQDDRIQDFFPRTMEE